MSHLTTVKSVLKDEECIRAAAKEIGVDVIERAAPRFYFSGSERDVMCDLVLKLPGRYDLGLKRNAENAFDFVCDNELLSGNFGRGSEGRQLLGEQAGRLKQEYAVAVAMKQARLKGTSATRTVRDDGYVVVSLRA